MRKMILISAFAAAVTGQAFAETKIATFAGGCFWCVESDFEGVDGVVEAISGYTGGSLENPTYKQVSKGKSGHFEAVQITYDDDVVAYDRLLHLFFRSIDPLDAGGQFCDRGMSYATAVFFGDDTEERSAKLAKSNASRILKRKVATEILPAATFYPAEDYHQNYYKGENRVFTRFGWIKQSDAYKRYRKGCGRDARIADLSGEDAPFVGH